MINKAGNQAQAGRNKAGNGRLVVFSALSPAAQSVFLLIRMPNGMEFRAASNGWHASGKRHQQTKISPAPQATQRSS